MTAALAGAAAGLGALLVSEATLAWWRRRPKMQPLRVAFTGMLARGVWILFALIAGWRAGWLESLAFPATLFSIYLVSQIVEGFRFQRFARKRFIETA